MTEPDSIKPQTQSYKSSRKKTPTQKSWLHPKKKKERKKGRKKPETIDDLTAANPKEGKNAHDNITNNEN